MAAKGRWTFPILAAVVGLLPGSRDPLATTGRPSRGGVGYEIGFSYDPVGGHRLAIGESYVIDASYINPATGISRLVVSANGQAAFFHQWNQGDTLRDTISQAALRSFERALRSARFCRLPSVSPGGLFNYTSVTVNFKSAKCVIVLRDTDWERNRRARMVSKALERIKRDVCHGDCPGSL